jgi:hypothetical protein
MKPHHFIGTQRQESFHFHSKLGFTFENFLELYLLKTELVMMEHCKLKALIFCSKSLLWQLFYP